MEDQADQYSSAKAILPAGKYEPKTQMPKDFALEALTRSGAGGCCQCTYCGSPDEVGKKEYARCIEVAHSQSV